MFLVEFGKHGVEIHLTPKEYQEVIAEGLAGVGARKDRRRIYPHGALAAHVVGYADIDNRGLAGIEGHFDGRLRRGERIALSIDIRVQHVLREEIAAAVKQELSPDVMMYGLSPEAIAVAVRRALHREAEA